MKCPKISLLEGRSDLGSTLADDMAPKSSHWTWRSLNRVFSSRLWDLDFRMNANFNYFWREDFWPLKNSPALFLLSTGKTFLMSVFQEWLKTNTAKVVGHYLENVWCRLKNQLRTSTSCESPTNSWKGLCFKILRRLRLPVMVCTFFLPHSFILLHFPINMLGCRNNQLLYLWAFMTKP